MRKNLIILFLLLTTTFVKAQESPFRLQGGINLSSYNTLSANDGKYGFHVGMMGEVKMTGILFFQTGLFFRTQGGEYYYNTKGSIMGSEIEFDKSLYYLQLPAQLSLKFPMGKNKTNRFHIDFGGYLAFGVAGKFLHNKEETDAFDDHKLSRLDGGLALGVAVNFRRFYLGLNSDIGLLNLTEDQFPVTKLEHRNLGLSVGLYL